MQPYRLKPGAMILPAAMIAYGVTALRNGTLQSWDGHIREEIIDDNPHRPFHFDNYLQYSPAAAVYLLNAAGIKGQHNFRDRTMIYLMSNAMMGATVLTLKGRITARRPDGSGVDGFPSGHTATAFAAAEFLRQEYKDVSIWYGVGGYAAASLTAGLRLYNDKHWFSELLPGAAIGILSTKVAYWIYPPIERFLFSKKKRAAVVL